MSLERLLLIRPWMSQMICPARRLGRADRHPYLSGAEISTRATLAHFPQILVWFAKGPTCLERHCGRQVVNAN